MLQFSGNASNSAPFMFFVMNQMRRFQCVKNSLMKLKNSHPEKIAEFNDFISNPNFDANLETALQTPNSKLAKDIVRKLEPFVKFTAQKIPYSNSERGAFVSTIYAMCGYKGLPSIYFTLANDVKGVFQIRMSTLLKAIKTTVSRVIVIYS